MLDLDWNDLRFLLEIERTGTVRAAAKRLLIHHTTISRHLTQLQQQLGVRIVQRDGRRLVFTPAGRELLETAREVEHRITDTRRRLTGQDDRPHGLVRVAAPESIAYVLAPHMGDLAKRFPGISVDLSAGLSFKNLARMEADIVVRIVSSPAETLVGRRVGPISIRAYGRDSLLAEIEPCRAGDYPWVGWSERLSHFPMEAWFRDQGPPIVPQFTTDSETGLIALIAGGAGVGFLPTFVAKTDARLRLLACEATPTFENQAWVLMHEDLRAVPRMRIVSQWLHETCGELLTG